jgi:anti-anti-sigma regulatory factor
VRYDSDDNSGSISGFPFCLLPLKRKDNMPTQITQIEDPETNRTILRVSGSLTEADAELIERLCADLSQETDRSITIDVAELDFLDSDSASILLRMKQRYQVELEGVHLLVQSAIDEAERGVNDQ